MNTRLISLIRYGLFGTAFLFSLIVLGLSGHVTSLFTGGFPVPGYLGISLATAVFTMVAIGVSLGINFFRKGAFTSMVATELGWTFFLMILWIASAGDSTAIQGGASCNSIFVFGEVFQPTAAETQTCQETLAIIAFDWLNFFIMFGWHVTLIVFTITAVTRGQTSVWTAPVVGTDFFAQKGNSQAAYSGAPPQQYSGVPVQQNQYTGGPMQQTYPPAGYNTGPAAPGGHLQV